MIDLGVTKVPICWLMAQPVAVGEESAGAVLVAGTKPLAKLREEIVRDAARQLAGGLHTAWTHDRLREKSVMLAEQGDTLQRAREAGIEPAEFLRRSDAYNFFKRLGDTIVTGPTGNNLRDLRILLAY